MKLNRREVLARSAGALASGTLLEQPVTANAARRKNGSPGFRYSLNTSTLSGFHLPLPEVVRIAGKAGYDAIEPWIGELDAYVKSGGSLKDLDRLLRDQGLAVESAIGFFEWIVDDPARRSKALDEARRNMEMLRQIGGKRLAAPPLGATDRSDITPTQAAEWYRALLEIGKDYGIVPQAEVWGFSKTLQTLGEAAHVALAADHPDACVLPDVYHLYKGGSGFHGLKLLSRAAVHVLHVNDYPAQLPRETLTDADRVYPGDGIAPYAVILNALREIGFDGVLSLELFNASYWKLDPLTVAQTGLRKTREVVRKSLSTPLK